MIEEDAREEWNGVGSCLEGLLLLLLLLLLLPLLLLLLLVLLGL